jgi:hypothetical protein
MNQYEMILSRVSQVRRRWRAQMLVKGTSLFLACSIALLVLGVWGADLFGFRLAAVWCARAIAGGTILFAAVHFLYPPLRRRVTDVQVAQFVEEQFPQLQDRLVAAVEIGSDPRTASGLVDLLIRDALDKTSRLDFSVFTSRRKAAMYGSIGAAAFVVLLMLISWGPSFFQFGFGRLYMPWTEAAANSGRSILVTPGSVDIAKGSDQQIKAQLIGFDGRDVKLHVMPETAAAWTTSAMEPESRGSGFLYLLVEVQSSLRYYVEAQGVRSPTYMLTVTDMPRVEKISLRYTFPAYTGMPPQTTENEGDITALKGTRVDLNIRLNQGARSVRILFDDQSALPLERASNQDFTGSLTLKRSGSYVVQVESAGGKRFAGSPEYEIQAQDDAPPKISIAKPQRDLRATNVEEVFTELKAEDDIGLSRLELHYSVNGGREKNVSLYSGQARQPAVTAAHTFFLEDFGLQPGDIVSYYGKAFDNNNVTGPGTSSSDIYFIQVRPFEQKYTQSQQGGGPNGGGGQEQNGLSQQEKDIISATFKQIRDQSQISPKEYAENLRALALVQNKLQGQAQQLVERFQRRGIVGVNQDFANLTQYIQNAVGEMGKAAAELGAQKPSDALPEEQKALQQLMRAESLFRDIQVAFSSQGGGGGSDSQARAEDLADLFELEMNKLKNQYETIQRQEQQTRDQKLDEALERLKELAKRQEQLNERNRSMAMRGGSSAGSADAGRSQQQQIEEAEKLQRQLQRLSRERSSPDLSRAAGRLEQSIQEMRRALDQSQRKSLQDASAQGSRALQQLEDARQALMRGQQAGLSQGLDQAVEESRRILEEQTRIQNGVAKLAQDKAQAATQAFQQRRDDLMEKKSLLSGRVKNLGQKIDDLSRTARKTQREAGSKLNDASAFIREKNLAERILSGNAMLQRGAYDFLKGREDYVHAGLEELQKQLEAARDSLGQTRESKLDDAVNRTRQLADGLEALRRRMQAQPRGNGSPQNQGGEQQSRQADGQAQSQSGQRGGGQRGAADRRRGSESAGGPPNPESNPENLGASGSPINAGAMGGEEYRQFRREAQERLSEAQDLRRLLDRNSPQMPNLDKVLDLMRGLENSPQRQADLTARLKAAIDLLHTIDQGLSRELSQFLEKDKYLTSEDSGAPSAYKKLVEEYYKALAKGKQ